MALLDLKIQVLFFIKRLTLLGLDDLWAYVRDTNASADMPYHNNQHLFNVARLASQLYRSGWECNRTDERLIIVAALFHDYDHSGGELKDATNIERAIAAMREFLQRRPVLGVDPDRVAELIAVTEFPFVRDPKNKLEQCLRDADLLYSFSDATVPDIMDGLRAEMELSQQREITLDEFKAGQLHFINQMVFHTPFAQDVWTELKDDLIKQQQCYHSSEETA